MIYYYKTIMACNEWCTVIPIYYVSQKWSSRDCDVWHNRHLDLKIRVLTLCDLAIFLKWNGKVIFPWLWIHLFPNLLLLKIFWKYLALPWSLLYNFASYTSARIHLVCSKKNREEVLVGFLSKISPITSIISFSPCYPLELELLASEGSWTFLLTPPFVL